MNKSILDAAKPEKMYSFTSWWQLRNRIASEKIQKNKEAQRLALLSVVVPAYRSIK